MPYKSHNILGLPKSVFQEICIFFYFLFDLKQPFFNAHHELKGKTNGEIKFYDLRNVNVSSKKALLNVN